MIAKKPNVEEVAPDSPDYFTKLFATVEAAHRHPGLILVSIDGEGKFHLRTNLTRGLLIEAIEHIDTLVKEDTAARRKLN